MKVGSCLTKNTKTDNLKGKRTMNWDQISNGARSLHQNKTINCNTPINQFYRCHYFAVKMTELYFKDHVNFILLLFSIL